MVLTFSLYYYYYYSVGMILPSILVSRLPLDRVAWATTIVCKRSAIRIRAVASMPMTVPAPNWPDRMRKCANHPHPAAVRNRRRMEIAATPNANRPCVLPNRNVAILTRPLANGLRPVSILPNKSVRGTYRMTTCIHISILQ